MSIIMQVIMALPIIMYIVLIFFALRFVRRQNLSERKLIIWDAIIIFCPIGAFIPFIYFQQNLDS